MKSTRRKINEERRKREADKGYGKGEEAKKKATMNEEE
jgi:hypothetical protein